MRYTLEGVSKKSSFVKQIAIGASGLLVVSAVLVANALAAVTPVAPFGTQGWGPVDIRGGGVAEISTEQADASGDSASLKLSLTDSSSKAGYGVNREFGPVSEVSNLGFD